MPTSRVRAESWRRRTPTGSRASMRAATPAASMIRSSRSSRALASTGSSEQRHRLGL